MSFILVYYSGFAKYFVGGDDIWLYMSAPASWNRVMELFGDIGGTYRPIPFSLFSLYHLFEGNIYAMHWVPIVLHSVVVVMVYLLAKKLTGSRSGAIVASLVYGVSHIVFFDVFTLTGLVDQLFVLFSLGSIIFLYRRFESSIQERLWGIVSWILFVLAMFSKESFVSVLLVITYLLWQKRANGKSYLAYWVPTIIYFVFKLGMYRQQGSAYSYIISLETLGKNLFDYGLWLINWRHGWQMGMPYEPHRYYDWVSLLYAGLIGVSSWNVWQKKRQLFWLSMWWGVMGLIPFYFLGRALPFYLEFSLIGMCLMIAGGRSERWAIAVLAIYMSLTTRAQWVEHSFSARGVQAAERYRQEVVEQYDWSKFKTLCLSGMSEYELWATGVGGLVNMVGHKTEIKIDEACDEGGDNLKIRYENGLYYL